MCAESSPWKSISLNLVELYYTLCILVCSFSRTKLSHATGGMLHPHATLMKGSCIKINLLGFHSSLPYVKQCGLEKRCDELGPTSKARENILVSSTTTPLLTCFGNVFRAGHGQADERVQQLRAEVEAAEREANKANEIRRLEERLAALKARSAEGEHGLSGIDSSLSGNDYHDTSTSLGQPSSVHRDAAGVSGEKLRVQCRWAAVLAWI